MLLLGLDSLIRSGDMPPVIAIIGAFSVGGAIAIVSIVALQWRKAREAGYNARLKQMMIERGMSAADIERVIASDPQIEKIKRDWDGCCDMLHGRQAGAK